MSAQIPGADYVPSFRGVHRTRTEWQLIIRKAIAEGGSRRVEDGETFVHDSLGYMTHEIYANVAAPQAPVPA